MHSRNSLTDVLLLDTIVNGPETAAVYCLVVMFDFFTELYFKETFVQFIIITILPCSLKYDNFKYYCMTANNNIILFPNNKMIT